MYGVSWAVIQKLAQGKYKIVSPLSPQYVQKNIDVEKVKKLYLSGMSAPKIAKELNISYQPVYRILRESKLVRTISEALKGKTTWLGRRHSDASRNKISKARMGKYTGMDNPNWHGGKKHSNQNKRLSLEYKKWRREIKLRDKKCLECGSTEKLHAHHIVPVRDTEDINLLIDMNNGVTLCKKCHLKTFQKEKQYEIFYRALLANAVNTGKLLTDKAEDNPVPSSAGHKVTEKGLETRQ